MNTILETLARLLGTQILAILGLTLAQVILAVAVALKNKVFEWAKLGDFYASIIVPKLLGWLACAILGTVVVPMIPADLPEWLGPGITTVAFVVVVTSFLGAILANLKELEILPTKVANTLTAIGVPDKKA